MARFSGEANNNSYAYLEHLTDDELSQLIERPGIITDSEVAEVYEAQDVLARRADTAWQQPQEI